MKALDVDNYLVDLADKEAEHDLTNIKMKT